jgi:hypothetical protein
MDMKMISQLLQGSSPPSNFSIDTKILESCGFADFFIRDVKGGTHRTFITPANYNFGIGTLTGKGAEKDPSFRYAVITSNTLTTIPLKTCKLNVRFENLTNNERENMKQKIINMKKNNHLICLIDSTKTNSGVPYKWFVIRNQVNLSDFKILFVFCEINSNNKYEPVHAFIDIPDEYKRDNPIPTTVLKDWASFVNAKQSMNNTDITSTTVTSSRHRSRKMNRLNIGGREIDLDKI